MKQKSVVYSKNYINRLNQDIIQFFPEVRPVSSTDKTTFQDVARMVMLDRYAQKDLKLITLATGDLVVVMIKNLKRFAVRGLGYIHRIYEDKVAIKLEKQYLSQVPPEDIQPDQTIIRPKNLIEKPLEIYYEQIA